MIDFGTWLYTKLRGEHVGTDDFGNRYYRRKKPSGRVATLMRERRWVIYNGDVEASKVPAEWHGWLHHTYQAPPTEEPLFHQPWEEPHQPNLTGSDAAYAPKGSLRNPIAEPRSSYDAWQPE